MKLFLNGNINVYYIQTLCMIFFPGAKFGADEQTKEGVPELYLHLEPFEEGLRADVTVSEMVRVYTLCERALIYDWCLSEGDYSLLQYGKTMMPMFFREFRSKQQSL